MMCRLLFASFLLVGFLFVANTSAQELRTLRDLNSYFPFSPPKTIGQWEVRKKQLQQHLQVSLGLFPTPTKTDLRAVIHGKIDFEEYSIEKVYFESMPGFHVTGNLYRPKNDNSVRNGKRPAILCPHGHWANGRFLKNSDEHVAGELKNGAEKFRENARSVLQARCAHLAKMGCVVFHYDMIGYADSQQITQQIAHGFSKQRPEMINSESWGLFSPQAESNLQSVMGLQTWNSIRAVDFLEAMPDVDSKRIGVTGASGGGTQTFVLAALDGRIAACVPAVMVGTAMQGGCTCENCCYLRVGTGNVEIAALFAPKPMHLTAANDWTKEMKTKGFPELQKLYKLLNKPDNVSLSSHIEFNHNYNMLNRHAMYQFFIRQFGLEGPGEETKIEFVEPERLSVYNEKHPKPGGGPEFERKLLKWWSDDSRRRLNQKMLTMLPDKSGVKIDESIVLSAWTSMIGSARAYDGGNWKVDDVEQAKKDFYKLICSNNHKEKLVAAGKVVYDSPGAIIFATEHGTKILDDKYNGVFQEIAASKSYSKYAYDLGFLNDESLKQSRRVKNSREAAAYTFGYNPPQILRRAFAPASLLVDDPDDELEEMDELDDLFLELEDETPESEPVEQVFIIADEKRSIDVAVALPLLKQHVSGFVLNTNGFRLNIVIIIRVPNFLPGGAKYFDVPGLLALAAPTPMLVFGEDKKSLAMVAAIYKANNAADNLTLATKDQNTETFILKWMNDIQEKNKWKANQK